MPDSTGDALNDMKLTSHQLPPCPLGNGERQPSVPGRALPALLIGLLAAVAMSAVILGLCWNTALARVQSAQARAEEAAMEIERMKGELQAGNRLVVDELVAKRIEVSDGEEQNRIILELGKLGPVISMKYVDGVERLRLQIEGGRPIIKMHGEDAASTGVLNLVGEKHGGRLEIKDEHNVVVFHVYQGKCYFREMWGAR